MLVVLNQEKKKICLESGKEGKFVLNQKRKDEKINRILHILKSFLSWFKDNSLSS